MESTSSNEDLIAAVERKKHLYDRTDDQYTNRLFIESEWKEIGDELGIGYQTARKRWTALRDYFVRTYKTTMKSGPSSDKKKKWYLFNAMLFMVPHIPDRKTGVKFLEYSDNEGSQLYEGNMETTFSNEALIAAVEIRRHLYDKNEDQYTNKGFIESQWKEIGDELGIDCASAKRRWTALRDYYVKSHKTMILTPKKSGSAREKRKKWYLYDAMGFLLPHIAPQIDSSLLDYSDDEVSRFSEASYVSPQSEQSFNYDQDYNTSTNLMDEFPQDTSSSTTTFPTPSFSRKRKLECPQERSPAAMHREVRKAVRSMKSSEIKDEDELFLLSLVPKVKMLDPFLKLECQAEMQMLLLKYMQRALGPYATQDQITHPLDDGDNAPSPQCTKIQPQDSNSDTSP